MRRFLFFILFLFSFAACQLMGGERIDGNGIISSEQRAINGFNGVSVGGSMDVVLLQGPHSVRVEADENLIQYIETKLDGNRLEVDTRDGYNLRTDKNITVYVTAPYFNDIEVAGSGSLVSQSRIKAERSLSADVSGSGNVKLDVDAPEVDLDIAGSSNVMISGNTRHLNADIAGSGELMAFNLMSEEAEVEIAGSGDAEVYASRRLGISVSGSGNVSYKGNPPTLNQNVAGSGSVRKAD